MGQLPSCLSIHRLQDLLPLLLPLECVHGSVAQRVLERRCPSLESFKANGPSRISDSTHPGGAWPAASTRCNLSACSISAARSSAIVQRPLSPRNWLEPGTRTAIGIGRTKPSNLRVLLLLLKSRCREEAERGRLSLSSLQLLQLLCLQRVLRGSWARVALLLLLSLNLGERVGD